MSSAAYHPFLLERIRADGILQMGELFAADEAAVGARVLHTQLLESALLLSDERVTAARIDWWAHTLLNQPERHPLTAGELGSRLSASPAVRQSLVRRVEVSSQWHTPASMVELWQQALQLATPLAGLIEGDAASIAAHGLLFRLRAGPVGPHNPGLCPLDLRARHQIAELPAPAQWPSRLRQDWLAGVAQIYAQSLDQTQLPAGQRLGRFERAQRALLTLELSRGSRMAAWQPQRAGRGLRALWTAWRAAVRAA